MKKLTKEKDRVIKMRLMGMSYSQIRQKIKVSKSTLSLWLSKYPLSKERIYELRGGSSQRIERNRNTKARKRHEKLESIYETVKKDIGTLSKRDLLIAGLALYWGEGTKSARDVTAFTNTDPLMIKFFIRWMEAIGISRDVLKVKLHLYKDMNIRKQTDFWARELAIPKDNFRKPYVKDSSFSGLTYKNSFGQGTCTVSYGNAPLHNRIMMSLRYLREIASKTGLS